VSTLRGWLVWRRVRAKILRDPRLSEQEKRAKLGFAADALDEVNHP
jgi:hypothetical protein